MPADLARAQAVQDRADQLFEAGELTKEAFIAAFIDLEAALGDGPEAEGIEALVNMAADDSWIDEAEKASAARERRSA